MSSSPTCVAGPQSPSCATTNGSAPSTSGVARSGPSTRSQTKVLQAFADQAAIAVANARLFNDLDAALERQTAMTEVLDAVSTARLDLQPVFDIVAHHADRLCSGTGGLVVVRDGDDLVLSAPPARTRSGPERVGRAVRSTTRALGSSGTHGQTSTFATGTRSSPTCFRTTRREDGQAALCQYRWSGRER